MRVSSACISPTPAAGAIRPPALERDASSHRRSWVVPTDLFAAATPNAPRPTPSFRIASWARRSVGPSSAWEDLDERPLDPDDFSQSIHFDRCAGDALRRNRARSTAGSGCPESQAESRRHRHRRHGRRQHQGVCRREHRRPVRRGRAYAAKTFALFRRPPSTTTTARCSTRRRASTRVIDRHARPHPRRRPMAAMRPASTSTVRSRSPTPSTRRGR